MRPTQPPLLDGQAFYNCGEAAEHYGQNTGLFPKEVIAFATIPPHAKILDIGCGTGRTTGYFHARGHCVIGVDISLAMIRYAKHYCREVSFLVGDSCFLNFKRQEFDVVVFSFNGIDCIYPYDKRLQALQEIKRVLKSDGLFIFSANNHCFPRNKEGLFPFIRTILKKERSMYIRSSYSWGTCNRHLTTPTRQIKELEQFDFELVKIVPRRILRKVASFRLIELVDSYIYYVFRSS